MTPRTWHVAFALLYALFVWWFVREQRRGRGDNPIAALVVAAIGGVALYTALEIRAPYSAWVARRPKYQTLLDPAGWLLMVISIGIMYVAYGAIAGWKALEPLPPEEAAQREAEERAMRGAEGDDEEDEDEEDEEEEKR